MCILGLKLFERSLCLMQLYAPKLKCKLSDDLDKISYSLPKIKVSKSRSFSADFNAHVGDDAGVWKGVTGQRGDEGKLVLNLLETIRTMHHEHFAPEDLVQRFVRSITLFL